MEMNDILFKLKCSVCLKWLIPPVYSCFQGHSVCSKCVDEPKCSTCNKKIIRSCRNLILEDLIETVRYPCQNQELGCKKSLHISEMDSHLSSCSYRKYKCRIDGTCKWIGQADKIAKHSVEKHDTSLWIGQDIKCLWKSSKPKYEVNLMMAYNELFYVHRKLQGEIMHWVVQYVGNSDDIILYGFQIEISTDQFHNRRIEFSEICHDDTRDDIDEIIDSGFCVAIPLSVIETYKNMNDAVLYRITINQV